MEGQLATRPFSVVPLWMKILLGGVGISLGVVQAFKLGFWNWASLSSILFVGIIFSEYIRGPLDQNTRWLWRVLSIVWTAAISAWFAHFWGWIPALAFAGIALISPKQEKLQGWKTFLTKPQNIVLGLLWLIVVIWFARDTASWVPTFCVVTTFFLLEGYPGRRRSLGENLRRRSFLATVGIATTELIWASLHPSFGNVAGLVAVVVLVSSDIYLHTEEHHLAHL